MTKRPISLIIDDPAPGVHLYRYHMEPPLTGDGRRLLDTVPNTQLFEFCDLIERLGLKGKFSVVPMAAGAGSLKDGFTGIPYEETMEWIRTVQERVMPQFAICSEILTHHLAIDLRTGQLTSQNEQEWVRTHSAGEVRDYIAASLRMLQEAGLTPTGVTSPWSCGIEVEPMYREAISLAFEEVLGRKDAWYFLHCAEDGMDVLPKVYSFGDRRIVSVTATFGDHIWPTIDSTETSEVYVSSLADYYITADGRSGELIRQLSGKGWPVLLTHWQSLYSNGLGTGLRVLALIGERIREHLTDQVEWVDFTELSERALAEFPACPMHFSS